MELGALNDRPSPPHGPRRRLGRRLVAGGMLVVVVAVGAFAFLQRSPARRASIRRNAPAVRVVPEGVRVRVEVLNATDARGLARRAMFVLRDAGFDVVYYGTSAARADSTTVLDRSGHPDWAALAARAMGGGRVASKPDSSRYLDLTVLIGRDWSAPSQPLYP